MKIANLSGAALLVHTRRLGKFRHRRARKWSVGESDFTLKASDFLNFLLNATNIRILVRDDDVTTRSTAMAPTDFEYFAVAVTIASFLAVQCIEFTFSERKASLQGLNLFIVCFWFLISGGVCRSKPE